jgi:hypothetical protein
MLITGTDMAADYTFVARTKAKLHFCRHWTRDGSHPLYRPASSRVV